MLRKVTLSAYGTKAALRPRVEWLTYVQWPAMVATVIAGWLTGSMNRRRRAWGFWIFLFSNALWMAWGYDARAWAVVLLQVFLAIVNIRGVRKNEVA